MQSFKLGFIVFASAGLLFLGACGNQASESNGTKKSSKLCGISATDFKAIEQ